MQSRKELEVVAARQPPIPRALVGQQKADRATDVVWGRRDIVTGNPYFACVGDDRSAEDPQEGAFPRPIGTQQDGDLALVNRETYVMKSGD